MVLAIDITDGHGLSNEAHCELLSKNSKVREKMMKMHVCTLYTIVGMVCPQTHATTA